MSNEKCNNLNDRFCERFRVEVDSATCDKCIMNSRIAESGMKRIRSAFGTAVGIAVKKITGVEPLSDEAVRTLVETCKACPYSTTQDIDDADVTEWGAAAAWIFSTIGNWLRSNNLMGISCSKCTCSCNKKAKFGRIIEKLSWSRVKGGCPDKDSNGTSRWDRALDNH